MNVVERLAEYYIVDAQTGCWNWHGSMRTNGYGAAYFKGKYCQAHRAVFEAHGGVIPAGLHLDHLCRNKVCVNPAHLEPVTNRENTLRGRSAAFNRARFALITHCPAGHEYTSANTYTSKDNERHCRACHNARCRERRRRRSQAAKPFEREAGK